MEVPQDDDFEVIDSQYELIESVSDPNKFKNTTKYQVTIEPTKTEVDLSIMENQYYDFKVFKLGQLLCKVERRFSQFELMFQILSKKQGGFIFPAFPANGLFAFMKSKVSISKDQEFIKRRTKMIARFFNIIINNRQFDPEFCSEMKIFLSPGKQFEARKQIQKGNKGYFNVGWNKLKGYFALGKQNKYTDVEAKINQLKTRLQNIYAKCRQLIDLLRQERIHNNMFLNSTFSTQKLQDYIRMLGKHDQEQGQNMQNLQKLQFDLFCQNEDLLMVNRIFDRINQLKEDEQNYAELKNIENNLEQRIDDFVKEKQFYRKQNEKKLSIIISQIKEIGRIRN